MNFKVCFATSIVIAMAIYFRYYYKEEFTNDNEFNKYLINNDSKDSLLRDFLRDLNDNVNLQLSDTNIDKCVENQKVSNESLRYAFTKIPSQSDTEIQTKNILNTKDPQLSFQTSFNDDCVNKANNLCEITNPYFYLSESQTFPAKWIGPYKDTQLPKGTNLTCFNKIYDCCKSQSKN